MYMHTVYVLNNETIALKDWFECWTIWNATQADGAAKRNTASLTEYRMRLWDRNGFVPWESTPA